jgi:hypothetical protein
MGGARNVVIGLREYWFAEKRREANHTTFHSRLLVVKL